MSLESKNKEFELCLANAPAERHRNKLNSYWLQRNANFGWKAVDKNYMAKYYIFTLRQTSNNSKQTCKTVVIESCHV